MATSTDTPWATVRPTYSTQAGLYVMTSVTDRTDAPRSTSIVPFLVCLVGFILAFGGTLVLRARMTTARPMTSLSFEVAAPQAAVVPPEVARSAELPPSAFEPPPATVALPAPVVEASPPVAVARAVKGDKTRKTRHADVAKQGRAVDGSQRRTKKRAPATEI